MSWTRLYVSSTLRPALAPHRILGPEVNSRSHTLTHTRRSLSISNSLRCLSLPDRALRRSYYSSRCSDYPAISTLAPHVPHQRLEVISRHLTTKTTAIIEPVRSYSSASTSNSISTSATQASNAKMSSQPSHPTLLIPGPIEFDDAVLQSMSHYR